MATYGHYALRVPSSLMEDLRIAAERHGVSMNGFIVQAVAEKVAVLRERGLLHELSPEEQIAYLKGRSDRARPGQLAEILARSGTTSEVLPGDELPEEWLRPSVAPD